ncbi:hypothetical protein J4Q44_G00117630 [Coregonus suidteri]|uniref:Uncharacterized protein n=1 Tax=Coregonus suidteri TaxID=861788 RepID=A0AAN8R9A4_9TELE
MAEKKMTSSCSGHLKSLMLSIANDLLEKEAKRKRQGIWKIAALLPDMSGGLPELQVSYHSDQFILI